MTYLTRIFIAFAAFVSAATASGNTEIETPSFQVTAPAVWKRTPTIFPFIVYKASKSPSRATVVLQHIKFDEPMRLAQIAARMPEIAKLKGRRLNDIGLSEFMLESTEIKRANGDSGPYLLESEASYRNWNGQRVQIVERTFIAIDSAFTITYSEEADGMRDRMAIAKIIDQFHPLLPASRAPASDETKSGFGMSHMAPPSSSGAAQAAMTLTQVDRNCADIDQSVLPSQFRRAQGLSGESDLLSKIQDSCWQDNIDLLATRLKQVLGEQETPAPGASSSGLDLRESSATPLVASELARQPRQSVPQSYLAGLYKFAIGYRPHEVQCMNNEAKIALFCRLVPATLAIGKAAGFLIGRGYNVTVALSEKVLGPSPVQALKAAVDKALDAVLVGSKTSKLPTTVPTVGPPKALEPFRFISGAEIRALNPTKLPDALKLLNLDTKPNLTAEEVKAVSERIQRAITKLKVGNYEKVSQEYQVAARTVLDSLKSK